MEIRIQIRNRLLDLMKRNGLLTTVDVVGISLFSYPKVNKAQEIKTKQKVVVLSIAKMSLSLPYHNQSYDHNKICLLTD